MRLKPYSYVIVLSNSDKAYLRKNSPRAADQYDRHPVTVEQRGHGKWAITQVGLVFNKQGEWEYEPMPSSRDDAFIKRTRFSSPEQALKALRKFGDK